MARKKTTGKTTKKKTAQKTGPGASVKKESASALTTPLSSSLTPAKSKTKKKGKKRPKKPVGTCFVLMPFKEPFDTYYTSIIKPAVSSVRLEPLRGDSLFTPTPIMGDIWKMIQNAKVLVAELTGKNANVFYELGLGHAIGKPIVLLAETMDDVPFDLRPLRVIKYDKNHPAWGNKLKNALATALSETMDTPGEAVPSMFRRKVKSQAPPEPEASARLAALERRIASLDYEIREGRLERYQTPITSPDELETRVRRLKNEGEALGLLREALRYMPSSIVRRIFEHEIPASIVRDLFEKVGL